jgi:hypothetical protein
LRRVAAFHRNVTERRFENGPAARAVDGVLACSLGPEAAARHTRLTMGELIQENKRLEVDLSGLKS